MPSFVRVGGWVALVACLVAGPSSAQRFSDVTEVVAVEIPVQVLVDGDPVRGLTAEDFEVRDGRKKRPILDFEAVDLLERDSSGEPYEDVSAAGRRHFLFLFDLALSRPERIIRARAAARELIQSSLHPTDLVAVGIYSARGSEVILGFTRDREQIEIAIDTLGMRGLLYGSPDPLGIVLDDRSSASLPVPNDTVGGVNPEAELAEILTSLAEASTGASELNTVFALSSSLQALAKMVGTVYGRKHVVFFSEGFSSASIIGLGVGTEGERQRSQAQAESAMTGQYWEVRSDTRFGSTAGLSRVDLMTKEFVNAGAVVHSVDIGGIRADGDVRARRNSTDGLFIMANKTGGELYRNYNNLAGAMQRMLERTSVTYVLTIQPEDLPLDGQYRRLNVKLKNKVKGAQILHRPGYFAPKPYAEQSGLERRMVTAHLLMGSQEGGTVELEVETRVLEGRKTGLTVSVEVDGKSLLRGHHGNKAPTEFFSYALDSTGSVKDFISRTIMFELDKVGEQLREEGYTLGGRLELPPGIYTIRTLVRNAKTGESGLRTSEVTIPLAEL